MESTQHREPWNKGKLVGQKPPLKPKDSWAIRIHLQNEHNIRDLALFNLAIDSKLRGCDLLTCVFATLPMAARFWLWLWSCSARPNGRFSLN
jgi:hypothetical protein